MANHSLPTTASLYTDVIAGLNDKISDVARGLDPATSTPSNLPTNAVRWSSGAGKWQRWDGGSWVDLAAVYAISISGNAASANSAGTAVALATPRSINGANFNGTGNITTPIWGADRFITIGAMTKLYNGSGNLSYNLTEIGASAVGAALFGAATQLAAREALGLSTVGNALAIAASPTAARAQLEVPDSVRWPTELAVWESASMSSVNNSVSNVVMGSLVADIGGRVFNGSSFVSSRAGFVRIIISGLEVTVTSGTVTSCTLLVFRDVGVPSPSITRAVGISAGLNAVYESQTGGQVFRLGVMVSGGGVANVTIYGISFEMVR